MCSYNTFAKLSLNTQNRTLLVLHASECCTKCHHKPPCKIPPGKREKADGFPLPKERSKQQCLCKLSFAAASFPVLRKDAHGEDTKRLSKFWKYLLCLNKILFILAVYHWNLYHNLLSHGDITQVLYLWYDICLEIKIKEHYYLIKSWNQEA